jgi:hypothetical protein
MMYGCCHFQFSSKQILKEVEEKLFRIVYFGATHGGTIGSKKKEERQSF